MDLDTYQSLAARTRNPALDPSERLLDAAAGLAEEAGEVLGTVRKHLFQQRALDREAVIRELGDALWCLSAVAGALDLSLGDVAHQNLDKLRRRFPEGFTIDAARERRDLTPATEVEASGATGTPSPPDAPGPSPAG